MTNPNPVTPTTKEEVDLLIARIGELHREMTTLGVEYGTEHAALKKAYEDLLAPLQREAQAAEEQVRDWCNANRAVICPPRSKTAKFAAGVVRWKMGRPKIVITDVEKVLARIKKLGLTRFIRAKEEINVQALAAEPTVAETISGVVLTPRVEEIIIEPVRV